MTRPRSQSMIYSRATTSASSSYTTSTSSSARRSSSSPCCRRSEATATRLKRSSSPARTASITLAYIACATAPLRPILRRSRWPRAADSSRRAGTARPIVRATDGSTRSGTACSTRSGPASRARSKRAGRPAAAPCHDPPILLSASVSTTYKPVHAVQLRHRDAFAYVLLLSRRRVSARVALSDLAPALIARVRRACARTPT